MRQDLCESSVCVSALARHGVKIERSTLAQWVGAAAAELQPLHDHPIGLLKASQQLFCDETRCPVLDPGPRKDRDRLYVGDRPR